MPGTGPNYYAADAPSWLTALGVAVLALRPGQAITINESLQSINLYFRNVSPADAAKLLTGNA